MSRLYAAVAAVCFASALLAGPAIPAQADSIYDSQVERKLTGLTSSQRAKVNRILAQGEREFSAILRKHGIDPNARPVFEKLQAASDELIACQRKQRAAMAEVLNEDQLDQYDDVIEATGARVRRAAQ